MKKIVLASLVSLFAANVAIAAAPASDSTNVTVSVLSVNEIIAPADLSDSLNAGQASAACSESGMAYDLSFKSQSAGGAKVSVSSQNGFIMREQLAGGGDALGGDEIVYSILVGAEQLGLSGAEDAPANSSSDVEHVAAADIKTLTPGAIWGSPTRYSEAKVCLKFAGGVNTFVTEAQYKDVLTFTIADL